MKSLFSQIFYNFNYSVFPSGTQNEYGPEHKNYIIISWHENKIMLIELYSRISRAIPFFSSDAKNMFSQ